MGKQRDIPESGSDGEQPSVARRGFLKAGAGVAGATVGITALSTSASAHFPETITLDIEPKSKENRIVLGSGGTVTVAVIQTDGFDPTSKPVHYRFGAPDVVANGGGARPAGSGQLKDVNGDGKMDLVLEFPLAETGFDGGEKTAQLYWEIHKGGAHGYSGTAPVTVVEETESQKNTLVIEGSGEYTPYSFSASGNVTLTEEDTEETVTGSTAYGAVGPDSDAYTFEGDLTDLAVGGNATVYVNDEKVDPSTVGSDVHSVTFEGTGSYASYEFTVSGEAQHSIYQDQEDSFGTNQGAGAVTAGQETYFFTGTLENVTTDGDVTITVDGEEIQP